MNLDGPTAMLVRVSENIISFRCRECGRVIPPLPDSADPLCVRCRYGRIGIPRADEIPSEYEIALETVAAPKFDQVSEERRMALEILPRLLDFLFEGGTEVETVGRRALVLRFLMRRPGAPESVADLAVELGRGLTSAKDLIRRVETQFSDHLKPSIPTDSEFLLTTPPPYRDV